MRAGEAGGWKRAMLAVAGVEERELKHEAVLLQAFQKPILRMGCAWAKMGVHDAVVSGRGMLDAVKFHMLLNSSNI